MAVFSIRVLDFNGLFFPNDLRHLCFVNFALYSNAVTELRVLVFKLICGYWRFGC